MRVAFTGDMSFSEKFSDVYEKDFISKDVRLYFNKADHVIANMESPVTDRIINNYRMHNHVSSPAVLSHLQALNIDILHLANNHMMDCGVEGLSDTLQFAEKKHLKVIGAGKDIERASQPLILEKDGIKIGIISIAYPWEHIQANDINSGCFTWNHKDLLHQRISELKEIVDWIVLVVHGGEEFSDIPMPYIRKQYLTFINDGVDIVVGHHPHVVQNYELIGKKAVFYGLGNFIFDTDYQRDFPHTEYSVILSVDFTKDNFSFDFLTTRHNREAHRIEPAPQLPIFRNLGEKDYQIAWRISAKPYFQRILKRRKKYSSSTHPLRHKKLISNKLRRHVNKMFTLIQGTLMSLVFRNYFDSELYHYLNE